MGFRRRAGGGRRDQSEGPIVDALRKVGARCWHVTGTGGPDLVVWFRNQPYVAEVKTGTGKRTENQADIPWPIWRTPDEALIAIGAAVGTSS